MFVLPVWAGYCDVSVVMVGNKVVLESEIRAKMRNENRNYDDALRELVSEKLFLLEAEKQGLTVTDAEREAEIKRIIKRFPDEQAFMNQLEKEGISYQLFKSGIEEKLKVRKLIKKNVVEKIVITPPEIARKMQEIAGSGNYSYNIKTKWFDNEISARDFLMQFEDGKEQEMDDAGWLGRDEMLPDVMKGMENIKKGELAGPMKIGNKYLVLLLKDVREEKLDEQILYTRAKNLLYNLKFSERFDEYLRELQSRTPLFYSD